MEALSRGAAAHQPVVLEILSELMDTETYVDPHVTEYGKHLIGNPSIFSIMITKTLTNAVKSYLDKKKPHNGTPSEPEPAPQHPFKKSGEPSLKSVLYNYSLFFWH